MKHPHHPPTLTLHTRSAKDDPLSGLHARTSPLARSHGRGRGGPLDRPQEDEVEQQLRAAVALPSTREATHRSFIGGLLQRPSASQRLREAHELRRLDTTFNTLDKTHKITCEAVVEHCVEQFNSRLVQVRISNRATLIDCATRELQALRNSIEQRREEYTTYLRRRMDRLNRNADMELLVDAEIEDIRGELARQMGLLRDLEEMFVDAITQRIG